jgi:CRISPR-associated protein Cas1
MYSNGNKVSGDIVVSQVKSYIDQVLRINIIKIFLKESFKRMIFIGNEIFQIQISQIKKIEASIEKLQHLDTYEKLLSLEGRTRQDYYDILKKVFLNTLFKFTKRTYYPPKDAFNSLLSLTNALLYAKINTLLIISGLNSSISYLHATNKRDKSLVYDISELYKPIICDAFVYEMISSKKITIEDFDSSYRLTKDKLDLYIQEFEKKLHTVLKFKSKHKSLIQCMSEDIIHFKESLLKNKEIVFIHFDKSSFK